MREKIKNYIIYPFIGFLIIIWNKLFTCQQYISLNFDDQSFLNWDFARSIDLIPYKDFNYPYGLLFYLKIDDIFWYIGFLILAFIICIFIFKIFINISETKKFDIFAFLAYCLFISLFIDLDTFVRYGSVLPFVYYYSNLTNTKIFFSFKNALVTGISFSLFYVFMIDMLLYLGVLFFVFTVINLFFKNEISIIKIAYQLAVLFLTFSIMTFFLSIVGINQLGFNELKEYLYYLSEISNFAKVPFPPSLRSAEGLFNIVILVASIIYILNVKIKNQNYYLLFGLIIIFLVFQQKSIVRAIHQQLSIFGFFIYLILLNNLYDRIQKKGVKILYSTTYIFLALFLVFLFIGIERPKINKVQANFSLNEKCINSKIRLLDKTDLKPYLNVKSALDHSIIFTFPGDPIFYALFKQRPPRYSSAYEATPIFAQMKQIEYISNENVEYVIINKNITHSQDGVPDNARNKKLYEYIKDNYSYYKTIDNFMIYKKNKI